MDSLESDAVFTKRGKRNILFILLILFLFAISIFIFIYLKMYKSTNSIGDSVNESVLNEPNESSFGTIMDNIEKDNKTVLVDPVVGALEFVTRNKKDGKLVPDPRLENGEIMLLVHKYEDIHVYYEVLSSTDHSIEAVTGNFVGFNPRINNDRFFMLIEEGGYDFVKSFDVSDVDVFPDNLEVGDRIVFTCQDKGCGESPISWLLLIRNDN